MAFKVYFGDEKVNAISEDDLKPVKIKIGKKAYSLDNITNYDSHMDLKLNEIKGN